jgi:hypothetical protein
MPRGVACRAFPSLRDDLARRRNRGIDQDDVAWGRRISCDLLLWFVRPTEHSDLGSLALPHSAKPPGSRAAVAEEGVNARHK